MRVHFDPLWTTVFGVVALCWAVFWLAIFARAAQVPTASAAQERKRDPASITGFILQSISFAIAGMAWRQPFTAIASLGMPLEFLIALLTMVIAIASSSLVAVAVRTLGKQWSLTARVLAEHKLVTSGPYRLVRNPIYTGMLGMLLASILAGSQWWVAVPSVLVFFVGTLIRVRAEERLLRESFGAQYDDYARRVPALIPFLV